ncbi:MAG: hypothetical protein WCK54_11600 [Desulfuromonadales bacterium]
MKRTIYIETSVISYRVARPSGEIIVLARQEITADPKNRADSSSKEIRNAGRLHLGRIDGGDSR